MLKKILKFIFYPFLGKKHLQWLYSGLFFVSLKGMNFGGGSTWSESGEEWVIGYFAKLLKENAGQVLFFDVGANVGHYALAVASIFESEKINYKIQCFEPAKKTFNELCQNTAGNKNIQVNNSALGDTSGKVGLYSDGLVSGLASLYQRDSENKTSKVEEVGLEILDNFCQIHSIKKIDFLKLDVEGNEYKVLLGAKRMLQEGAISFIQFEFGGTDIDARVFFRDFFILLSPKYNLYRILKNGLQPITHYKETSEIFTTTNYLAILKR